VDTSGNYEIVLCFESPDADNAEFVYEMVTSLCEGLVRANLIQMVLSTVHPTFEGDEIREESY
jgi:hypothetical protein